MGRYVLLVQTDPVEGREDEYNRWYDNEHLDDMLNAEGYLSCRRFKVVDSLASDAAFRYLAIYEIESDDIARTAERAAAGPKRITEAIKKENRRSCYELITERSAESSKGL
jgi:hypothetical protein